MSRARARGRRPCLDCGTPTTGHRCARCERPNPYDGAWRKLAEAAIAAQPWCTYCRSHRGPDRRPPGWLWHRVRYATVCHWKGGRNYVLFGLHKYRAVLPSLT